MHITMVTQNIAYYGGAYSRIFGFAQDKDGLHFGHHGLVDLGNGSFVFKICLLYTSDAADER